MRELHPIETQRKAVESELACGRSAEDVIADLVMTGWTEDESRGLVASRNKGLLMGRPARVREALKLLLWAAVAFGYGAFMIADRANITGPAAFAGIGLGGVGIYRLLKAYEVWRG